MSEREKNASVMTHSCTRRGANAAPVAVFKVLEGDGVSVCANQGVRKAEK